MDQTYFKWEIIAVNDGSTDNSLEIVQDYAKKDERIQVLSNRGTGIIEALRTAYELSHGEFVTRMDSDDLMAPRRLKHMVAALLERGKGHLALGQVKYFSARGISNGYNRYEKWLNKLTLKGNNFSEIYKECVIPSPCWMIHREDFERCGAFQSDRYPEDYDLAFRFYENNLTCIPCDEVLLYWRDYDTRTSRTSEHYAQNYFLDIKLRYFLKLDWNPKRPLTLWGAGNKGKTIAKLLIKKDIHFQWICDNPNKIGKKIYGQELYHFNALKKLENPQTIVTVANSKAQEQIRDYFMTLNKKNIEDYFFFC
jgi:glycosyltransferase involved in cell wall biosynthesis